jgi:hypothetical protein
LPVGADDLLELAVVVVNVLGLWIYKDKRDAVPIYRFGFRSIDRCLSLEQIRHAQARFLQIAGTTVNTTKHGRRTDLECSSDIDQSHAQAHDRRVTHDGTRSHHAPFLATASHGVGGNSPESGNAADQAIDPFGRILARRGMEDRLPLQIAQHATNEFRTTENPFIRCPSFAPATDALAHLPTGATTS